MKVIALLPMKGHSERVPNKNMRLFAGKPLYHRIAAVLEASPAVASILIDTDSEAIAGDATRAFHKACIIRRPKHLQGDFVSMNEIIEHDLSICEGEHFLQTHSTNPLLTQATLDRAIGAYFAALREYDSVFSVSRLQARLYWASGLPVNHDPQVLLRTQDLPPLFEENSNFYLFSKASFAAAGSKRIGIAPKMVEVEKLEAIDIDEESDFQLAEALYMRRESQR
jgi:CMP-N-acetylneuraminic acid synthetase